jgi:hypothetical protein
VGERAPRPLFEVSGPEAAPPLPPARGGWWYRGEHHALPLLEGTRYVHRVPSRRGVPPANGLFIGYGAALRDGMEAGLAELGTRLGCATRLEEPTSRKWAPDSPVQPCACSLWP